MYKSKINLKMIVAVLLMISFNSIIHADMYKSKIVIKAEWGSGANKFGIYKKAMQDGPLGSIRGPVAMDVDKKGNIYFFDPVNWRVNIYANNGKYKGNIKSDDDIVSRRGIV